MCRLEENRKNAKINEINMTLGKWIEDLIGCPSQCYYYFKDAKTGIIYCIYLRWRWSDPWDAFLVQCDSLGNISYDDSNWHYLSAKELGKDFTENEYKDLEEAALGYVNLNYIVDIR